MDEQRLRRMLIRSRAGRALESVPRLVAPVAVLVWTATGAPVGPGPRHPNDYAAMTTVVR